MSKEILFSILGTIALCSLSGCGENRLIDRSLVFATHTTMGLELSVSPAETSGPVNMILGYKRTEGVINPVYHSEGIETPDQEIHTPPEAGTASVTTTGRRPRYREESYSVIAKFAGETGGSADKITSAGMSVAQWFATGEAAKTIAGQPGIAGAVTGSSEIAEAAAKEPFLTMRDARGKQIAFTLLNPIYLELRRLGDEGNDSWANALADNMDTIKPDQLQYDFQKYVYLNRDLTDTQAWPAMAGDPFLQFHGYCTKLDETMKHLRNALTDPQLSKYNGTPITDLTEKRATLYGELKDKRLACERLIEENQDIIRSAVDYLYR